MVPVQVYAACGRGRQGSLQVIHSGVVLEELHTSSPACHGIYRMWTAVMHSGIPSRADSCSPHTLIVISFVNGTRVMSAGGTACSSTAGQGPAFSW